MPKIQRPPTEKSKKTITNFGPSKTEQQFKKEVSPREILNKYRHLGVMPPRTSKQPRYGDFSIVPDYHTMKCTVAKVEQQFWALPSDIRKRFRNRPELLMEHMQKPENRLDCYRMGLTDKPEDLLDLLKAEDEAKQAELKKTKPSEAAPVASETDQGKK